jgi:hypothetical protein
VLGPDRLLVLAGQGFYRLPAVADRRQRTVLAGVGAQHACEHYGVARIGLLSRLCVTFAETGPPRAG